MQLLQKALSWATIARKGTNEFLEDRIKELCSIIIAR
jgi:hypothetical protein